MYTTYVNVIIFFQLEKRISFRLDNFLGWVDDDKKNYTRIPSVALLIPHEVKKKNEEGTRSDTISPQ